LPSHEGKVNVSTKINHPQKTPSLARKILRNQIYFQSCDAKAMQSPGAGHGARRRTTIVGGLNFCPPSRRCLIASMLVASIPSAADASPKKKDTPEESKANDVSSPQSHPPRLSRAHGGHVPDHQSSIDTKTILRLLGGRGGGGGGGGGGTSYESPDQPAKGRLHQDAISIFSFFQTERLQRFAELDSPIPKPRDAFPIADCRREDWHSTKGKVTFSTKIPIPHRRQSCKKILRNHHIPKRAPSMQAPRRGLTVQDVELTIIGVINALLHRTNP